MTDTVISSATKEVVIGFERPFVMIGERINPTGRKILAAEMAAGDFSRVESDTRAQLAAAGTPIGPYDVLIAGQARARQLVLVTHNVREFSRVAGLAVEDWHADLP